MGKLLAFLFLVSTFLGTSTSHAEVDDGLPEVAFAKCNTYLGHNLLTAEDERMLLKKLVHVVRQINQGHFAQFQEFQKVQMEGEELHVYARFSDNGKNIFVVAVLNAETKEVLYYVGPGKGATETVIYRKVTRNAAPSKNR